ncbi:MAG TPA: hypothetical protein VGO73_14695, partial [Pyrinomonadaceae bacterium]|nr:hypothetical protein [Pyrinomonadaceae bacterium]
MRSSFVISLAVNVKQTVSLRSIRHHSARRVTARRKLTVCFTYALLLSAGCQWSGAGKFPVASSAPANTQPTTISETFSSVAGETLAATSSAFTNADFARHVRRLKAEIKRKVANSKPRTAAGNFSFVIQRPFVVIGDEPKNVVQQRAEGTVKWAVDRLKQDFFPNDPKEILDIWLFKDAASYEKHARLL